jgi:hypothetical protein
MSRDPIPPMPHEIILLLHRCDELLRTRATRDAHVGRATRPSAARTCATRIFGCSSFPCRRPSRPLTP